MQSKIPLPTDNIYKFYALFGLLLLVSSMVLFVINYSTFQQRAVDRFIELSVLNELKELTPEQAAKKELLTAQSEVDVTNKKTYTGCIGIFIALSFWAMFYGFRRWHKDIQPQQDLLLAKQIEKIELEISAIKKANQLDA